MNKCAPYSGTACHFSANETQKSIECKCIHFKKYNQLVNATGHSFEQNGLLIYECQLSSDVCSKTCPQENNFSGHCNSNWNVTNYEKKLRIECQCEENTIYEHYEQILDIDISREFQLIRTNRCLNKKEDMENTHIELIVVIVVASVVAMVAIISLFLWCR